MTLTADQVDELTYGGLEGFKLLEKSIFTQTRWSTYYRFIFEHAGRLYGFDVERGSTENQDVDQPNEYECFEAEAYQKTAYRKVEGGKG